jgi:hypothetical protein
MSSVYQHMTSADPLLLGANPMQSMDLGTGKHASAGVQTSAINLRSLYCPIYRRQQHHSSITAQTGKPRKKVLSMQARCSSSGAAEAGHGVKGLGVCRLRIVQCAMAVLFVSAPADPHADGFEVFGNGNTEPLPTTRRMTSGEQQQQQGALDMGCWQAAVAQSWRLLVAAL